MLKKLWPRYNQWSVFRALESKSMLKSYQGRNWNRYRMNTSMIIKHLVIMDYVSAINYSSQIILPPYVPPPLHCTDINAFIKNVSWFDFIVKSSQRRLINILSQMMKCLASNFSDEERVRWGSWCVQTTQQIAENIYSIDLFSFSSSYDSHIDIRHEGYLWTSHHIPKSQFSQTIKANEWIVIIVASSA